MKHKCALMLLLILFSTFAICLPVYPDDSTIYGCYKKIDGQLRILNQGSKCLPSEVPISWNQAGPPSPANASIPVRQIEADLCTGVYGWCPDGFSKWAFRLLDPAVNETSVVTINIVNPLLWDYGCEVATKSAGEFLIFCIGYDYVKPGTILQYAVFNP